MTTNNAAEIRSFFGENGYYLAKNVYAPDGIAALERDFDRIVAQIAASGENINARWGGTEMRRIEERMGGGAETRIVHTHNVQQFSGLWLRALLEPAFLDVAAAILGPDVVLHHTKLFQKPPEVGSPFPMHQDWSYFPTIKDTMIAAVIHVSAATDAMGCLRVYPGTHRLGRGAGTSGQAESELLAGYPIEGATVLEAEPGDVAFFHYFTLHGSRPNTSQRTRKTVLVQMYAGDDHVEEGNPHTDERLALRGWNHHSTRSSAGARK